VITAGHDIAMPVTIENGCVPGAEIMILMDIFPVLQPFLKFRKYLWVPASLVIICSESGGAFVGVPDHYIN